MLILKLILGWVYQHFISLVIIIAVLIGGAALKREYKDYRIIVSDTEYFQNAEEKTSSLIALKIDRTTKRVNELKEAADGKLKERISVISSNISTLKKSQCNPKRWLGKFKQCVIDDVESNVQIAILEQERTYLQEIRTRGSIIINKDMCGKELQRLETTFLEAFQRLEKNEADQKWLKNKHPRKIRVPGTGPYKRYRQLNKDHSGLLYASKERFESLERQKQACKLINVPGETVFAISNIEIEKAQAPLRNKLSELERKLGANWWNKLLQPIKVVLPAALTILASILFLPMAIKAFFYFLTAPIASRMISNCLMPETSGMMSAIDDVEGQQAGISAVFRTIAITGNEELLIQPDYVQVAHISGNKDTRWFLDYKFPLSSLASGMFALTRYRNNSGEGYGITSGNPLYQLAVISLPAGSAIVLHPRCLIGIVQQRDNPVTITRHWRLTSLHAWLTLQLRYLVFHGPGSLIVKGCGGVSIKRAAIGQGINQAATIGFSANLAYATSRAEPFFPYLNGRQGLFNDTFPSGSGYFIHEKAPNPGPANPITGRGFPGLMDSVFKVFGL